MKFPFYAFYDHPTTKAKLIRFYDDSDVSMDALETGAEWVGEKVEIINEYIIPGNPPGKRWIARTEKGSIFQDKPIAFMKLTD